MISNVPECVLANTGDSVLWPLVVVFVVMIGLAAIAVVFSQKRGKFAQGTLLVVLA